MVDKIVGDLHNVFRLPKHEQAMLGAELFRQNFAWHYAENPFFRAQCDAAGAGADSVTSLEDLWRIPLFPIRMFKQTNASVLLSVPLTDIDLELRSTGTSGVPSVTRRDVATTTRTALATLALYRDFFEISNGVGLFLCPSTAEAPEMGMVKVFNLFCGLLDDRAYLVRDYAFRAEEAIEYLSSWQDKQVRHIFGPPFIINRLLRYMEQEDVRLSLDDSSFVITLGGWKRFNGESISRDAFIGKLEHYLGVRPEQVRDMYGLIESNMLAIECEHHHKHVPPWCYVSVRDVDDLGREVPLGQPGVIGVLDALNTTYPGYLLTEDVGQVVADGTCPCGRTGQVLVFNRRLQGAELGCCAVSIERFMETRELTPECELVTADETGSRGIFDDLRARR